jgi:hypothetical protein
VIGKKAWLSLHSFDGLSFGGMLHLAKCHATRYTYMQGAYRHKDVHIDRQLYLAMAQKNVPGASWLSRRQPSRYNHTDMPSPVLCHHPTLGNVRQTENSHRTRLGTGMTRSLLDSASRRRTFVPGRCSQGATSSRVSYVIYCMCV